MKYIDGMHVYNREEIQTQSQVATITTYVCPAYQTILGYNEVDQVVRASYIDYSGNPVDYNGEIIFEFAGEQQVVQAVNGLVEIPFEVVDAGVYVVRTVNPDVTNGEVTINV